MPGASDTDFLWRALELAGKGEGHTRPNPPVGAVIVKNGKIIGEGWHRRCGGNHAEVAAIKDATRHGETVKGATLYVTLEPCSRSGRVGACTDAIVAAGIKKVVYAVADPNPKNRGRARRVLAKAGVDCVCPCRGNTDPGVWKACGGMESLLESAKRLIAPFAKHVATGMPFVTVKLAMSLDGKICDDFGNARWISSAASRRITGRLRETVDAILVGAETVRKDNPSLLSHGRRNDDLIRVIVSKSGRLPKSAQVFTDGAPNETLVYRDVRAALEDLGRRGVMHVLCEGGLILARSLADQGLVDRWWSILCPLVIGSKPLARATRFRLSSSGFSDPLAGDCEGEYDVNKV